MNVSWAWQNQSQGLINWTFQNTSNQQESAILLRSGYYFGDAFYEIYVNNGYSFLNSSPSALSGSPPLAVIAFPQPDGTNSHIVTFVFTLGPGKTGHSRKAGSPARTVRLGFSASTFRFRTCSIGAFPTIRACRGSTTH